MFIFNEIIFLEVEWLRVLAHVFSYKIIKAKEAALLRQPLDFLELGDLYFLFTTFASSITAVCASA